MTTRRVLWAVIGVSTVLRLAWAAGLGGYTNEAYYYMYAQNLDWGYFDHPPMVGIVSALGLKLAGGISPVFGLRFGFILLFAGSSWLLARLTARCFGAQAGVLAALALNATVFYGLMIGTFAEPDGPLLFFWLLTLDRLWVALETPAPGRTPTRTPTGAWLEVGLAWGAALLSKYHAVLLPVGTALYLLLQPTARRCLRQAGPYLAALVGFALFTPVIVWNFRHGWASFLYQGNRAGGFHGLRLAMFLEALIAQILYLTPWIWVMLVIILVRLIRRGPGRWSESEAFLTCHAVPPLGLFLGLSTFQRIMPHWPLIGFVALFPLLGRLWAVRLAADPSGVGRRLTLVAMAPIILALLFITHAHTGLFQDSHGRLLGLINPTADPTVDTIRWDQVARELKRRGLLDDPRTFLFTDYWCFSAELAMATRGALPVACFHRDSRSFTFWSRPEDWVGRDGIFVRVEDGLAEATNYAPWFSRIEPLDTIPIVRAGATMQAVRLYRCLHLNDPFPFGYSGPGHLPRPDHTHRLPGRQPVLGRHPEVPALR
jgi:4-amino-4-deoxy-L-arabinose transferase-like glycosyltransferase